MPISLLQVFDEKELELLIGGLAKIDVKDWRENTTYAGFKATDPSIEYFWQAVTEFSLEQRARLLQFVSGTSRVPMGGFKELHGAGGPCLFCIEKRCALSPQSMP